MAGDPRYEHAEQHVGNRLSPGLAHKYLVVGQRPFKATCFASDSATVDPGLVDDALIGFEVGCKPIGYIQLILEDDKDRISVTGDNLEPGQCRP